MAYWPQKPPLPETPEQLRARIPGWGVDLDPRDRPAVPQEVFDPEGYGAHWEFPERQPERYGPRERSIEHAFLTPVFGTSAPLHGVSGRIRRFAYDRFSEGRNEHWLLLIAADRVDTFENLLAAAVRGRPDDPVTETGVRAELTHHGVRSRRGRVDVRHQWLDPLVVAGPWAAAGAGIAAGAVAVLRRATRTR
ncbi:hypothetical protein GTR02_07095 [Kineococcus sp. R8]|uniref:hypothetical protein n=1 Tax=Kineococcus siccus TaxID=2696567 RepID=UPI001412720F|nr:hypothetical protein [Kineococcus siccus]NAZ81581.1 hypothetical protein [Kineococcus siccus]